MLAFVISLDDVVITELVKSGGQDTLPTYMLGQLRRVVTPEMNAISTVFLAISIALVTIFFVLNRRNSLEFAIHSPQGEKNEVDSSPSRH